MAIQIIKNGIADTIQDMGRYGYQHLGIQTNGYLDYLSAKLANFILGNNVNAPIFEIHFPASSFYFTSNYTICISGANFVPVLNEKSIPLHTPIEVKKNDTLQFLKPLEGRVATLPSNGFKNCKVSFFLTSIGVCKGILFSFSTGTKFAPLIQMV